MHAASTAPAASRRVPSPQSPDEQARVILAFAAEHRLLVLEQATCLLGATPEIAEAHLRRLRQAGLIRDARRFACAPAGEQITRAGLRAIGSDLPTPRRSDPGGYLHDVGTGWLWLAARSGTLGPLRQVVSERQMRSADGRVEDRGKRFGVRLGGMGPGGRERLHYPDLLLETRSGHRVALELELTLKSPGRRETILAGYAADPSIDAVVYMVDRPSVARAMTRSARQMGVSHLIHVQAVSFDPPGRVHGRGAEAARLRLPDDALAADRQPHRGPAARRQPEPARRGERRSSSSHAREVPAR
jgi:hypothetical protein